MNATHVIFDPSGENVEALYLNGALHMHGDYYHDKINVAITNFLDGMGFTGMVINKQVVHVPFQHSHPVTEGGEEPPKNWPDEVYAPHGEVQ
jgi:hypothetical protein